MRGPGRPTAVAIALAYLAAGVLPCGGASAAAFAVAATNSGRNAASRLSQPEARELPQAAATRDSESTGHGTLSDHREHAVRGAHAGHAGHAGHAESRDAGVHSDPAAGRIAPHDEHAGHHPGHTDHAGHVEHAGHAEHSGNGDGPAATPATARAVSAPCGCGCSGTSDAPSGNTARIAFGLLAAAWERAAAAAPPHPAPIPPALPQGPHSELDPVPI